MVCCHTQLAWSQQHGKTRTESTLLWPVVNGVVTSTYPAASTAPASVMFLPFIPHARRCYRALLSQSAFYWLSGITWDSGRIASTFGLCRLRTDLARSPRAQSITTTVAGAHTRSPQPSQGNCSGGAGDARCTCASLHVLILTTESLQASERPTDKVVR